MTSDVCNAFVATVGTFDGLHQGHRQLLQRLIREADVRKSRSLVVTFDSHPRQVLGRADGDFRLLSSHDERFRLLASSGVDEIRQLTFTPEVASLSACQFLEQFLVRRFGVRTLVLGYDNSFGSRKNNDFDHLPDAAKALGVELLYDTPFVFEGSPVSSSRIRKALALGDIGSANAMLGRPYDISGSVVKGRGVGRQLSFPTANIVLNDPSKALPSLGVYAVEVDCQGRSYRGMANLGSCPTFDIAQSSFEVHLLDFDGDIYGQELSVRFVSRLRDIRRFSTPEELSAQLSMDKEQVYSIIHL